MTEKKRAEEVGLDSIHDWHGEGQKNKVILITKTRVTED
jgi:hypothetical protein